MIWFNPATRHVDLWKIANGQWAGSVDIGTHPAGWQPSCTGDFNGDGTSDVALVQSDDQRHRHLEDRKRPMGRQRRCRPASGRLSAGAQPATSTVTAPATSPGTIHRTARSISGRFRTASGPAASPRRASARLAAARHRRLQSATAPATSPGTIRRPTTSTSG